MNCCICAGTCNHVGNHSYCAAHGGSLYGTPPVQTTTTLIHPDLAPPAACATCEAKEAHIASLREEAAELRTRLESWEFFVRNRLYRLPVESLDDDATTASA